MKKIGRNDICPCGSGKKFKHCHLGREDDLMTDNMSEISMEVSKGITGLSPASYGRSQEMTKAINLRQLTGTAMGIRFIDLKEYKNLKIPGRQSQSTESDRTGGVIVNPLKTAKSDPDNIYVAISSKIGDSILVHQLAHVLDYLGGSKLMPGIATPLSFDMGVPSEHLEHPNEFGYWLDYLQKLFDVQLDADDTIISFLYNNGMLIMSEDIKSQNQFILKSKSEQIFQFLSSKNAEINELICHLPGYIGAREIDD